jgi:transcriptional regulator with XRE-family HTH domain
MPQLPPNSTLSPLATDLRTLGQLVGQKRLRCELSVEDAADLLDIAPAELNCLERGESIGTEPLLRILNGLGLTMLVMPKNDASDALHAVGHAVDWSAVAAKQSRTNKRDTPASLVLDRTTPTLFIDFDGTLHVGDALMDENGQITLDSGRPPLEFAPLLVELLEPYPAVEIVLTTSWLQKLPTDQVISYLPTELACRVVGTTRDIKPRLSYVLNGSERTYVISSYVYGERLKNWLAIDDSVYGAYHFGREPGELVEHFLLLDSARGISDAGARQRIRQWLVDVHDDLNF